MPYKTKLVKPDGTVYDATTILSCQHTSTVNGDTDLRIGSACSDSLKIDFLGRAPSEAHQISDVVAFNAGDRIEYYRVHENGTEQKMGVFWCDKPTVNSLRKYTVQAYDAMYWQFEEYCDDWLRGFFLGEEKVWKVADLVNGVCEACGVQLGENRLVNLDMPITPFSTENGTYRQIVEWIAEAGGCYAHMDENGNLCFQCYESLAKLYDSDELEIYDSEGKAIYVYASGVTEIGATTIVEQSHEDFSCEIIGKLVVRQTEEDIGVFSGTGENAYIIQGNPLLTTMTTDELQPYVDNIFNRIRGLAYTPGKVKLVDDGNIKAGMVIRCVDLRGSTWTMPVFTVEYSPGGVLATVSATGSETREAVSATDKSSILSTRYRTAEMQKSVELLRSSLTEVNTTVDGIKDTMQSTIEQTAQNVTIDFLHTYDTEHKTPKTDEDGKPVYDDDGNLVYEDSELAESVKANTAANAEVRQKFTFSESGLEISAGSGATLTLKISNNEIAFYSGGTKVAFWDGNYFRTNNLLIDLNERAVFGKYAWIPRNGKGLMFKYAPTEMDKATNEVV